MLNYTATDQDGHQVVGVIDDRTRTRRDVALELYELGYRHAAIHDDHTLVAGIDTEPNGHRYWWASLKLVGCSREPVTASQAASRR